MFSLLRLLRATSTSSTLSDLPVELMLQILGFLPHTDVWRLRRVSRAWNEFLQEEVVVKVALHRYETHDPTDAAHVPSTIEARIAVMRAHHTGIPVAKFPLPGLPQEVRNPVLKGKYLACSQAYIVYVVDLSSGKIVYHALVGRFVLSDTYLITFTTKSLRYTPPTEKAWKSISVRDPLAVAGCGQLIAVQAADLTIYNEGVVIFRAQLGTSSPVSVAIDRSLCYVTGVFEQEDRPKLALTTIDYATGVASYRPVNLPRYTLFSSAKISSRLCGGLHVDYADYGHFYFQGEPLIWTRAGAYWKGNFYHDWLHEGPAIAVHRGHRRFGLIPCKNSAKPLVNESFLVDVANKMVYTFDRTATRCALWDVTWVESRQQEDFKQLEAAKEMLEPGHLRRYTRYEDRTRIEEDDDCGCVVQ